MGVGDPEPSDFSQDNIVQFIGETNLEQLHKGTVIELTSEAMEDATFTYRIVK